MNTQELEDEVVRLTAELEKERRATTALKKQIVGMKEQEVAMTSLFRSAQPPTAGRAALAQATSRASEICQ